MELIVASYAACETRGSTTGAPSGAAGGRVSAAARGSRGAQEARGLRGDGQPPSPLHFESWSGPFARAPPWANPRPRLQAAVRAEAEAKRNEEPESGWVGATASFQNFNLEKWAQPLKDLNLLGLETLNVKCCELKVSELTVEKGPGTLRGRAREAREEAPRERT